MIHEYPHVFPFIEVIVQSASNLLGALLGYVWWNAAPTNGSPLYPLEAITLGQVVKDPEATAVTNSMCGLQWLHLLQPIGEATLKLLSSL